MAKKLQPQTETPAASSPETPQEVNPPISIVEPVSDALLAEVTVSDEKPEGFSDPVGITSRELEQLHDEARRDNEKRDFHDMVMDARRPKPEPPFVAPPLAPRVVAQTEAELAVGRAMVEQNEKLRAHRSPPPPQEESNVKPVFRPGDYVPNQKKGQGNVQVQTLR